MSPSASEPSHVRRGEQDHFARLGLPPAYAIDRDELERRYLERSTSMHPDRFVRGTPAEQRAAMEASAGLNEAHAVLRDPVARAEYLCKLGGIDLDSNDPQHGAPAMDQAFLIDMIERREQLSLQRARGSSQLASYRDAIADEYDDAFAAAVAALQDDRVRDAACRLVVCRYLRRLLDEIDASDEIS